MIIDNAEYSSESRYMYRTYCLLPIISPAMYIDRFEVARRLADYLIHQSLPSEPNYQDHMVNMLICCLLYINTEKEMKMIEFILKGFTSWFLREDKINSKVLQFFFHIFCRSEFGNGVNTVQWSHNQMIQWSHNQLIQWSHNQCGPANQEQTDFQNLTITLNQKYLVTAPSPPHRS
jgi:hypothetical protein